MAKAVIALIDKNVLIGLFEAMTNSLHKAITLQYLLWQRTYPHELVRTSREDIELTSSLIDVNMPAVIIKLSVFLLISR